VRTSYSGNTLAFQAKAASSILAVRSNFENADMAQLVERTLGKGEVGSSNLPISTTLLSPFQLKFFLNVYLLRNRQWQKQSLNVLNRM
jgi:hypothetical protein